MKMIAKSLKITLANLLLLFIALFLSSPLLAQEAVCVVVKLEIVQDATLEIDGFNAELKLRNNLTDYNLTDMNIELEFLDKEGVDATGLFNIDVVNMENITAQEDKGKVKDGLILPPNFPPSRLKIIQQTSSPPRQRSIFRSSPLVSGQDQ